MFSRIAAKFARFMLNRSDLSIEDRNLLTACLLDKLAALPLRDMIASNEEGKLLVNGRPVDLEGALRLRESAHALKDNFARKLIHDQVLYTATTFGVHKLEDERQSFFMRAAIWWGQQEDKIISGLAQDSDPS